MHDLLGETPARGGSDAFPKYSPNHLLKLSAAPFSLRILGIIPRPVWQSSIPICYRHEDPGAALQALVRGQSAVRIDLPVRFHTGRRHLQVVTLTGGGRRSFERHGPVTLTSTAVSV